MALLLKISEQSYDKVTHTVTMSDDTGVFNVVTNPGGYGTPNPDRSSLALILSGFKIDGQEYVQWVDPLTDATFGLTFVEDGAYDMRVCSAEYEVGSFDVSLMSVGRVFYSVVDDKLYKVILDDGVNVLDETTDLVGNSIETSLIFNYLVTSQAENRAISIFCDSFLNFCTCLREEYNDLRRGIDSMTCYFNQAYYSQVNTEAEFIKKINI